MTGKQSKLHDRCAATQHGFMGSWGSTRWGSHRAMWGQGWTGNLWRWGGSTDCPKLEFFFDGIDDVGYTLKSLGLRGNLNHQQPPEGVYGWWPAHGDDEGWPLIWLVKNSGWRDVVLDVNIQLGWHPRLTSIGVTWNFLAAWRSLREPLRPGFTVKVPKFDELVSVLVFIFWAIKPTADGRLRFDGFEGLFLLQCMEQCTILENNDFLWVSNALTWPLARRLLLKHLEAIWVFSPQFICLDSSPQPGVKKCGIPSEYPWYGHGHFNREHDPTISHGSPRWVYSISRNQPN